MSDQLNANLIRLYCDGELSPEQSAQLQQCLEAHPECRELLSQQMEVDQRLRDCLRRAMQSKCPQTVCDCVRQAISESNSPAADTDRDIAAHEAAEISRSRKSSSAHSWTAWASILFSGQQRANVFAVAATLALVVGAVLFGIYGRPIDEVPAVRAADLVAEAARVASQQHDLCVANKPETASALNDLSPTEAQADLSHWLSVPLQVFDLSNLGYEFVSAGHCSMPWNEPSGHLLYKSAKPGQHVPMVSVFISPNRGQCGEACHGSKKWSAAEGGSKCRHKVLYSSDHRVVYFLVCCNEPDLDAISQKITADLVPAAGQ